MATALARTVIFKVENGFNVIKAFGHPAVDGVATRKAVAAALKLTVEYQNWLAKKTQLDAEIDAGNQDFQAAIQAGNDGNATLAATLTAQYQAHFGQAKIYESELKGLTTILLQKQDTLFNLNLIYFDLRQTEKLILESEYNNLKASVDALTPNQAVTIENNTIPYFVGKILYQKISGVWTQIKLKAGEAKPPAAKLIKNLTQPEQDEINEQLDNIRISRLSKNEKDTEKFTKISGALTDAARYRSELEIAADPDPLGNAQIFYNTKKAAIEAKYQDV